MKNTKELTWQDAYKLPLKLDPCGMYAWSSDMVMALTFCDDVDTITQQIIVNAINGSVRVEIKGFTNTNEDFYVDGKYIFCVRGWGHLTGTGALNLEYDKAIEIQNGFIDHVLKSFI